MNTPQKISSRDHYGAGGVVMLVGALVIFAAGYLGLVLTDDDYTHPRFYMLVFRASWIGIPIMAIGHQMTEKFHCSKCGNPTDKKSRTCTTCREQFAD